MASRTPHLSRAPFATFALLLTLGLGAGLGGCGGGADTLQAARADLNAGQFEAAERKLAGVETTEAADLLREIASARERRASALAKLDEILAGIDTSTENQLRDRLKTLRERTTDPVARERIGKALSELKELIVAHGGAGKARAATNPVATPAVGDEAPLPASADARDKLIAGLRSDVREALQERQWARAEESLRLLAEQPRERTGDLSPLRLAFEDGARADAKELAAQAKKLAAELGAGEARTWVEQHLKRFPKTVGADTLQRALRDIELQVARGETREEETPAPESKPEPARVPARADLLDPRGAALAELLVSPPVPEDRDAESLVQLARESSARGELAFARQCFLAASRKLLPGDLRDDYIGEAQDLRARLMLRAELIDSWRADPTVLGNLGIDSVDAQGWKQAGESRDWNEQHLDVLKRIATVIELSPLARRGIAAELLRSPDATERDRAITDLGRMVESGDVTSSDAANMVARARGGIGASERWLLDKGRWVTSAEAATTASAELDAALTKEFLKAGPEAREAALAKLVSGASEFAAHKALRDRAVSAIKSLEKDKSSKSLVSLAALRTEFDAARKAALDLIFDENVYFYPYNPPEPPHTAGEYARAQQRVDELVSAVRDVLQRSKFVKLSREFRADCDELAWCREVHAQLKLEFGLPESIPEYLLVQDPALEEVDLTTFAWTADEAKDLAYDRAVVAWNERQFSGYARRRDAPAAEAVEPAHPGRGPGPLGIHGEHRRFRALREG
ncbi:MAG: hypothetical protein NTV21_19365 [Planctomycetota bacterium]|nr:hypothetical protein [Planctomycetota bacterium]